MSLGGDFNRKPLIIIIFDHVGVNCVDVTEQTSSRKTPSSCKSVTEDPVTNCFDYRVVKSGNIK